ncbi:MAG: HEAT repeat domain-containing protein [Phycisphaerae bacterium]
MTRAEPTQWGTLQPAPRRDWIGHLVVGVVACALTVSIVGSLSYLIINYWQGRGEQQRVNDFIASIEHRTPDELAYVVQQLRRRERVADRLLPMILAAAERGGSERQRLAGVRLCAQFVDRPRVERLLFDLRRANSETVAANAVAALAKIAPPAQAAARLVECLDVSTPAVVDVVCDGLVGLGEAGVDGLRSLRDKVDADRRLWLVGLIGERRPRAAMVMLDPFLGDPDARVRARAVEVAAGGGGIGAVDALVSVLGDSDATVRHAAARAIGKLTGRGFSGDEMGVRQAKQWAAVQPRAAR